MELKRISKLIYLVTLFLVGVSNSNLKANNLNISAQTLVGANLHHCKKTETIKQLDN